ncbi:MAG: NAD(P)-binding protein [Thiohalocapsa sp.]
MASERGVKVAIVGSGCAAISTAFELTRPEHRGKYKVTVYQTGWRLGGKGASGRGPAQRIEEHGLHLWLGFYENAFRLMRECYAELKQSSPADRAFSDWRDAFVPESYVGITDPSGRGDRAIWTSYFPPGKGLPGDPLTTHNPFTLSSYLARTGALVRALLLGLDTRHSSESDRPEAQPEAAHTNDRSPERVVASVMRLLNQGLMFTAAGLIEAATLLEVILRAIPSYPENVVLRFLGAFSASVREAFEELIGRDDESRVKWEIIDLVIAIVIGVIRFRLLTDPRGLDAINDYECREWLRLNGASEGALDSPFVRGLYDLALAYENGDPERSGLAAGQAIRGSLRMFFTYRGALFWKMRAGMGDVVFAPFYKVLKARGVKFQFFHRLENLKLVEQTHLAPNERPYVEALEFAVQAKIRGGKEYQPLVDVRGVPSWPSGADFDQLVNGAKMRSEGWEFESHWDPRKTASKTLRVTKDFDFVVLGVSVGAIPHVSKEIIARDGRWRDMVDNVKTVATQAFQIWMNEDMNTLGWKGPPVTLSGFTKPFDTWADMGHLAPREAWPRPPLSIAYFCNVLADPECPPSNSDADYPSRRRAEVRRNALRFLQQDIRHLWPKAVDASRGFRWELLVQPEPDAASETGEATDNSTGESVGEPATEARFDSQFWAANVNPTDRYVLALPGTLKYRISPLDNSYDNLTIAGDWTDCGFNEGCVEAAVMSGRLAAHAISGAPALEDIIGYDHP